MRKTRNDVREQLALFPHLSCRPQVSGLSARSCCPPAPARERRIRLGRTNSLASRKNVRQAVSSPSRTSVNLSGQIGDGYLRGEKHCLVRFQIHLESLPALHQEP